MRIFGILETVLPVLVVTALGYLFGRKGWISEEAVAGMKSFVMNLTLPVVVFAAFYRTSFHGGMLLCAGSVTVVNLLGMGAGALINRLMGGKRPMLPFLTCGFEIGMLGYALYGMLTGPGAQSNLAMMDAGQGVFIFTVYFGLLNARTGKSGKAAALDTLRSPILIALVLGILLGATGLGRRLDAGPLGGTVEAVLTFIKTPTSCVILFVIGAQMQLSLSAVRRAAVLVAVRTAVMATLCALCVFVVSRFVPMTRELLLAYGVLFILPASYVLPIYEKDPAEQALLSSTLSLNTLVTLLLFAVISAVA